MPTCKILSLTTRGQSDTLPTTSASTTSSVPFSSLTSTATFALPTCWAVLYKTMPNHLHGVLEFDIRRALYCHRSVTLSHGLSLLLIASERRVSTFLFTSLHPVCLHSELKFYSRRYIPFFHVGWTFSSILRPGTWRLSYTELPIYKPLQASWIWNLWRMAGRRSSTNVTGGTGMSSQRILEGIL